MALFTPLAGRVFLAVLAGLAAGVSYSGLAGMANTGTGGPSRPRRAAAANESGTTQPPAEAVGGFNLFEKAFINSEVIAYGDSLADDEEDPLKKLARDGCKFIKGFTNKEQLNRGSSPAVKEFRNGWVTDLKYLLGEEFCNCGHDLSDISKIIVLLGFATEECKSFRDGNIANLIADFNSSIEYLKIGVFGGLFHDGGNFDNLNHEVDADIKKKNSMVRHFFDRYVTLVDGCILRCKGTERNPKGNKWYVMEKQLKEQAESSGETGPRRMLLWRLLGAINLVLHVVYQYARTDGKEPVNILLACIRNVEWLFNMSNCKPIGNEFVRLAPIPHPESCSLYLPNILVHTVEKLDGYARSADFHFQGYPDDLFFPDIDENGNVVKEDGVELKLPSLDKVEYFKIKANILGKSEAQIAAEREWLREKCRAAAAESDKLRKLAQAYFSADGLPSEMEEEYRYWLGKYGNEEVLKEKMTNILEGARLGASAGGVELARRATETNAILSRLVGKNVNMTLEDVFEVVAEAEGSSGRFHVELDAFAKHFDIAVEEVAKEDSPHVIEVEDGKVDGKVVVIFPGDNNATNRYFRSYSGKEYVDDWRRVLLLREGIDLGQWRYASEKKALNIAMEDQAAKDARAQEPEHTEDYNKKKERKAKKGNVGKLPSFMKK